MKKHFWNICKITFIVVAIIAFSPIVMPYKETAPMVLGMPRTLWLGLLVSLIFITLNILGALFINEQDETAD